ncbi:MAG: phenylalanine 4-monooxygenase, partial [Proteobacteria bacterium]
MQTLPKHLQKYVVEQNYEKYTPVEQASWRYVMRQLRNFLSKHAHESYQEGLKKTGIEIERIPRIEDISKKLQEFGWRAIPVSGFIPPAAFMELQSLGVLPIASDMRTLDHLLYTPAPDIVHEAAGHAPILIQPEFAEYLRQYALVAKKAIISKEDIDLYEAIRDLSDIKESAASTKDQITAAEEKLTRVSQSISHVSEAAELG